MSSQPFPPIPPAPPLRGPDDTTPNTPISVGPDFVQPPVLVRRSVTGNSVTVRLANGATVRVGLGPSTAYHQQTSGSQVDLAAGKTVILRVNGRFGSDDQQAGGTLGTATDVTVVP